MRALLLAGAVALAAAAPAAAVPMRASAYSPDDAGSRTACGDYFGWQSNVVAHRTLPCGTRLAVEYRGRVAITFVRDRGPFIPGRDIDLGPVVWRTLGASSAIAWAERTVDVRILPARPVRPVQTRRPPTTYPPRRVFAAQIRTRVQTLRARYGSWPIPVFDSTLTGQVAGWVLPQPPGRVTGARSTCAPFGSATDAFACRVSAGRRLLERVRVRVSSSGTATRF